ncbi:hypothetical protein ACLB2K_007367 [Fragaria x ananassa]
MVAETKIMCQQNVEVFGKGLNVHEVVEDVVASISPKTLFDPTRPLESVSPAAQPDVKPADKVSDLAHKTADQEFFPRLCSGSFADIGPRRYMEDEHLLIDDLSSHLGSLFSFPTPSAFYGVFDGHGGPEAAAYVRKNVMRLLFDDVNFPRASEVNKMFLEELETTLSNTFHQVDLALADDCSVSSSSGTTALTAMIFGRLLMVANAGDCRAVLCRKGEAIDMSQDHRPIYPSERKRVEELGGYVDDGYLNGVLSVSRALGDWDMKFPRGSASPLIAAPEFRRMELTEEDEFLIIGCDGIWDVMSSQHAVSLVRRGLRRHDDPEQCAKDLVMEALRLNTFDNLTVIVVCFSFLDQREPLSPPQERRYRCCSLSAEALCSLRNLLDSSG